VEIAMLKTDAVSILAQGRGNAISVATMQSAAPWKDMQQASFLHVDASGCMGSASSMGIGLALGQPNRKVIVLDGDGSLLMQLGSLVTAASLAPQNYYHFVFANGAYESSGNQTLPGQGIFDFCGLAQAAGYRAQFSFEDAEDFRKSLPFVLREVGPVFIELIIAKDMATPRWPGVPMAGQVKSLRDQLAGG
jgi:sulfopyruvate decarboxylase subunit beta